MSFNEKFPGLSLKKLIVKDFRNLKHLSIELHEKNNLFIGPNGQGKTNCLEAISIASSLSTLQSLSNQDMINHHSNSAIIKAGFSGDFTIDVDIEVFPSGKNCKINKKIITKSSILKKHFLLVTFIPNELNMIEGSPSLRRNALDQAAFSLFYEHGAHLKSYEKVLRNRNQLLKNWPIDKEALKVFSRLMIEHGSCIMYYRTKTLEIMQKFFVDNLNFILKNNFKASLNYEVQGKFMNLEASKEFFFNKLLDLENRFQKEELARRISLFGPHLDELVFGIDNINVRKFASRGESRALVLAFKLAQMHAIKSFKSISPLLILDDIVSEFDQTKIARLMDIVKGLACQSFFSSVSLEPFNSTFNKVVFSLENGSVIYR